MSIYWKTDKYIRRNIYGRKQKTRTEEISSSGTTVLLVEQNAKKALSIADRAYVLETGNIVLEGKAKDIINDDSIKKAYLGE